MPGVVPPRPPVPRPVRPLPARTCAARSKAPAGRAGRSGRRDRRTAAPACGASTSTGTRSCAVRRPLRHRRLGAAPGLDRPRSRHRGVGDGRPDPRQATSPLRGDAGAARAIDRRWRCDRCATRLPAHDAGSVEAARDEGAPSDGRAQARGRSRCRAAAMRTTASPSDPRWSVRRFPVRRRADVRPSASARERGCGAHRGTTSPGMLRCEGCALVHAGIARHAAPATPPEGAPRRAHPGSTRKARSRPIPRPRRCRRQRRRGRLHALPPAGRRQPPAHGPLHMARDRPPRTAADPSSSQARRATVPDDAAAGSRLRAA